MLTPEQLDEIRARAEDRVNTVQASYDRKALLSHLAAVTRERDEARVNERRYLWLRDQPSTSCLHVEREDINEDGPTDVWYATNGVELDAFIDDALRDAQLSPKEQRND